MVVGKTKGAFGCCNYVFLQPIHCCCCSIVVSCLLLASMKMFYQVIASKLQATCCRLRIRSVCCAASTSVYVCMCVCGNVKCCWHWGYSTYLKVKWTKSFTLCLTRLPSHHQFHLTLHCPSVCMSLRLSVCLPVCLCLCRGDKLRIWH